MMLSYLDVNDKIADIILTFIDKKLFPDKFLYSNRRKLVKRYLQIYFVCLEKNPSDPFAFTKFSKARYYPAFNNYDANIIAIHRFDEAKPNILLLFDCIYALHEYGHYISLQNCKKQYITQIGFNYNLDKNLQKTLLLKEELNAWI
jgi:hypothetical protein